MIVVSQFVDGGLAEWLQRKNCWPYLELLLAVLGASYQQKGLLVELAMREEGWIKWKQEIAFDQFG